LNQGSKYHEPSLLSDGSFGDNGCQTTNAYVDFRPCAHRWRHMSTERINEFYLGRIVRLTLLSPSIIEAILEGRPPNSLASGTSKSKC
jgi:hypothetical protein